MTRTIQTHPEEESIRVLGVRIDNISSQELLKAIQLSIREHRKIVIANVNVHALNLACELAWFRNFQNKCDVVFCDGYGVLFAARLRGMKLKERFTYADILWPLAEFSENNQLTLYILGAKPGVAEKAKARLTEKYPRLQIVGLHHGYFNKSHNSAENRYVISDINTQKPDILIVGFGMPMQEQWLADNWNDINASVALTGGAVFDYISGEVPRAPRWMTDHGLEWLGRLIIEPRRLWKRYVIGNPLFLWRVFIHDVLGVPLSH
jgi:N-acetylglucosaminyldiphosphoundecaprenol N-acetyl-beta-D-mannosaminyltransferase